MNRIRAVFLDVGWTLAYPRASMWQIFADLCRRSGVAAEPYACEQLVRSLWVVGQEHAERKFHSGATYPDSDAEFVGMFTQMGQLVFGQFGVLDDPVELGQRFLEAFWTEDNWRIFPEVLEVLAALRQRGVKIGVLSNAPSNLLDFLDRLGISPHLDFTVVSAIEGVKKPDRRIFSIALARAGVQPEEAVHVGDMYIEDIVGGRAAGVHPILMERGERALFPSFRESDGCKIAPAAVISDLRQLLEHVPSCSEGRSE